MEEKPAGRFSKAASIQATRDTVSEVCHELYYFSFI